MTSKNLVACLPLLALTVVGVGCAGSEVEPVAERDRPWLSGPSSLAFTPEAVRGDEAAGSLDLARRDRQPAAFAGYELPTVTYNFIQLDDRLSDGRFGNYDRTRKRTISTQLTTRVR